MPPTLLGIDLGTTVLKMALVRANTGTLIAETQQRLPVVSPEPGAREIAIPSLNRAVRGAIRTLQGLAGPRWNAIEGIGISAQGGSSIIADRATGKPHTPMFLWNDERCHAQVRSLAKLRPPRFWSSLVSYAVPATGLARIMWLRERHASRFTPETIHVGAGEFLFHAMTGIWRQDAGNAIQIGSYHAYKQRLDDTAFKLVDLPLDWVAPLRNGHETATLSKSGARMLGLAQGIPIAGPYIDQEAAYMSLLTTKERPLQCSLGTAWVGNFVLDDKNPWSSPTQMILPSPSGEGRFIIQALPTGNVSWDWALRTFLGGDGEAELRKASALFTRQLLPRDGVVVLPWFTQANPLDGDLSGGGAMLGISADLEPVDFVRAVAAGLVFELHRFLGNVVGGRHGNHVVISGGASRGPQFRRLIAAVFHPVPVFWQRDYNLAAARGSLYALDPKAAHAATQPLGKPGKAELRQVNAALVRYRETFNRVYGESPEQEGYRL